MSQLYQIHVRSVNIEADDRIWIQHDFSALHVSAKYGNMRTAPVRSSSPKGRGVGQRTHRHRTDATTSLGCQDREASVIRGLLKNLQEGGASYPLSHAKETLIGREPECQIVLGSDKHGSVSRRHLAVRPLASPNGDRGWEICDLSSSNGTFVNGDRLQGCRPLEHGDRIALGYSGPLFVFECEALPQANSVSEPLTVTQLIPILSAKNDLLQKAYLLPGILTTIFVVLMFATVGGRNPMAFNLLLAIYLGSAAYYFVYRLCGKRKPWWILLGTLFATVFLLQTPVLSAFLFLFRQVLPGNVAALGSSPNAIALLFAHLFGAGFMEELFKAIPVVVVYYLWRWLPDPRRRVGVWEPLDGILLGAASALGFTLMETLGQYVPEVMRTVSSQAGSEVGLRAGLELLIPRILGSVSGHMAYSGCLGYSIGLSVLKPAHRWQILGIGYLTASVLHAVWNTTGSYNILLLAFVGAISYAWLVAAILKARSLSPTLRSR